MSKLADTQKAYDRIQRLLDQELLNNKSSANEIKRARELLDTAFFMMAWGHFEHLMKTEARERVADSARSKGLEGYPWKLLNQNIKQMTVRQMIELIFIADQNTQVKLSKDYGVRNDSTHEYKTLSAPRIGVSGWIAELEEYVEKFST